MRSVLRIGGLMSAKAGSFVWRTSLLVALLSSGCAAPDGRGAGASSAPEEGDEGEDAELATARQALMSESDIRIKNNLRAGLPAAGEPGRLSYVTDVPRPGLFFDTGSAWKRVAAGDVVNVEDYGANGGDGAFDGQAFIDAIAAAQGRTIYVPAGDYYIDKPLSWTTQTCGFPGASGLKLVGAGTKLTRLIGVGASSTGLCKATSPDARVAMITVDGGDGTNCSNDDGLFHFQFAGAISDLSIQQDCASGTGMHGIKFRGTWSYTVERVVVDGLRGDGIQIAASVVDKDATNNLVVSHSRFRSNTGWGINVVAENAIVQTGQLTVENNFFRQNGLGAIRWNGQVATILDNGIHKNGTSGNPYGGILIEYNGQQSQSLTIARNEFDTNNYSHIQVDQIATADISLNQFTRNAGSNAEGYSTPYSVVLGDGSTADPAETLNLVLLRQNRFRINDPASAHTAYDIKSDGRDIRIEDTEWGGNLAPLTRVANAGTRTTMRDGGVWKLLGTGSTEGLRFQVGAYGAEKEALRITPAGLAGFGTDSPLQNLVVTAPNSAGFEVAVGSGITLQSINRNTSAYTSFTLDASQVQLRPAGTAKLTATSTGVGVGTTSPTSALDVNADVVRVRSAKTPLSGDSCNQGEMAWDESYIYVCTANHAWKRAALGTY